MGGPFGSRRFQFKPFEHPGLRSPPSDYRDFLRRASGPPRYDPTKKFTPSTAAADDAEAAEAIREAVKRIMSHDPPDGPTSRGPTAPSESEIPTPLLDRLKQELEERRSPQPTEPVKPDLTIEQLDPRGRWGRWGTPPMGENRPGGGISPPPPIPEQPSPYQPGPQPQNVLQDMWQRSK